MSGPRPPRRRRRTTAGLRYDGEQAPKLVAAGHGHIADRIVALAQEHGIPVREDPVLAEALAQLEIDRDVPPELWRAVAESLLWAYRLQGKSIPARAGR